MLTNQYHNEIVSKDCGLPRDMPLKMPWLYLAGMIYKVIAKEKKYNGYVYSRIFLSSLGERMDVNHTKDAFKFLQREDSGSGQCLVTWESSDCHTAVTSSRTLSLCKYNEPFPVFYTDTNPSAENTQISFLQYIKSFSSMISKQF